MDYKKFVTGMLDVNTYLIPLSDNGCIIVDPSDGCDEVVAYLKKNDLRPKAILLTHGHFDHIMGIPEILGYCNETEVFIHENDRIWLTDPTLNRSALRDMDFVHTQNVTPLSEGTMEIGGTTFKVLHVPGHTQGGCAFLFDGVCFCGDTIFAGSVGRTDFPGGSHSQLIASIREKILTLPPETVLCTGHGGRTSVDRETRMNPYLK